MIYRRIQPLVKRIQIFSNFSQVITRKKTTTNKQTNKTDVISEWREQIELSTNPALVHRRWIKHVHSSVSIAATRYPEHVRKVGEALPIVLRDPHMTIAVQIGCEISCQNNNGIPVVPCPVHICQVVTVIQLELSRERCNLTKIKSKPKIKSRDPAGTLTKAKDHQIFHCISHLVHFLWWVNFWAEFYCTVSLLSLKSLIKKKFCPLHVSWRKFGNLR